MSDEPRLRPGTDIAPTLIAIGRNLLAGIGFDGAADDATLIHDFRRQMKRWRAFLRLMEPALGEAATRLTVEARDLARTLAGARDAQAALDALEDLGEDYAAVSAQSLKTIASHIVQARSDAEATTLTDEARERLRTTLARTADGIEHWPLDEVGFHEIAAGLTEGYRRARRAIPADWTGAQPEDLHRLRQRVVTHRYQMEWIEPLWPRQSRVWVGEAQRLRERLGKHQDLAVLDALLRPKQLLARWRSRLAPAIAARQRDHIEAAMRHCARLFAEKPQAFRTRIEAMWQAER
jgi:CHAD domain-containing protein